MGAEQAEFLWLDGEIVPWAEGKIHVGTEAVLRGENVFEGIRGYWNADQEELYIFKMAEHLHRLRQSAKIMRMTIPYTDEELTKASVELLRACKFRDTMHFRPVVYFGEGESDTWEPSKIRTGVFILAVARARNPRLFTGIKSCISTWRRNSDMASPSRVKSGANYHNSRLALVEAKMNGFGTPIMMNDRGKVSESPGSCFMMVRDGTLITPPVTADILESITRSTLLDMVSADLGIPVVERDIDRTEIYIADEAFFCGSGHEVQPIISVDHYDVGNGEVGPITKKIQSHYFSVAEGRVDKYRHWLTPVYQRVAVIAR